MMAMNELVVTEKNNSNFPFSKDPCSRANYCQGERMPLGTVESGSETNHLQSTRLQIEHSFKMYLIDYIHANHLWVLLWNITGLGLPINLAYIKNSSNLKIFWFQKYSPLGRACWKGSLLYASLKIKNLFVAGFEPAALSVWRTRDNQLHQTNYLLDDYLFILL